MTKKDPTQEELMLQVADLRAQLATCTNALDDLRRQRADGEAQCLGEIEQMRQAREAMGLASMIVENSPAVLFRRKADENATLVYVSDNISQWGYTSEEFMKGEVLYKDILLEEDLEGLRKEIEGYKADDVEEYTQEYRIKTADGEVRWVSDETSVVRDENGAALFNQGVLVDVTSRKRVEAALSSSEFKFRRTIESAGEGYCLLDDELRIKEVNDAYCRMLGYDREELVGKRPSDFATPEYKQFIAANRDALLKQDYRRFEGSMYHKDGHVVPMLVNSNTLCDAEGAFIGHVAFVADITEQKKAVELAGEVQKSLLPDRSPHVPGLDVAGTSVASEIAGGDYFDYLQNLDDDGRSLSVAVGDISGHGVDAALLMTTARGFLRMRAAQPGSPAQIVTEMNRHLAGDLYGSGRFMTLFYLKLDPEAHSASWVRAGHDPAMIYCPAADAFEEMGAAQTGLPLGVIEESDYAEQANELLPGQIIAIGTDGIWESRNPEGEMYGKERFKDVLKNNADQPAQDILDAVFKSVKTFTGGAKADDDITLVIVKYGYEDGKDD